MEFGNIISAAEGFEWTSILAEAVEIGSKEDHRLHNKRRSRMRDIICVFAVSVHRVFDRLVARACDRTLRHSRRRNNNRLLFRSLKAAYLFGSEFILYNSLDFLFGLC